MNARTWLVVLVAPLLVAGCVAPEPETIRDNEELQMEWGEVGWTHWEMTRAATVQYDFVVREGGPVDACLTDKSEWDHFSEGRTARGHFCGNNYTSGNGSVNLDAGSYAFGFRCLSENGSDCWVTYSLTAS